MKGRALVIALGLGAFSVAPAAASGAGVRYPGRAPCDKTLQKCINKSPRGTKIKIAKNGAIKESIEIEKSLSLLPKAGFDPVIGANDVPRTLEVRNAGSKKVNAVVRGIEFRNAEVQVNFSEGSGHRFVLEDSSLVGPTDGVGMFSTRPSTLIVRDNELATEDEVIDVGALPETGAMDVEIARNRITTSDAPAGVSPNDSGDGIELSLGGAGQVDVDVFSNLVYGVAGCNCGGAAGIKVRGDPADATVNLVGNTVDDTQSSSSGLDVVDDNPGGLAISAFDNLITNASRDVVDLPDANPNISITHDFNDLYDPGDPPDYGDYPPGPNTDTVDPLYVAAASADYHLQEASPEKRQGLVCTPGGQPATDLDGNDRVERVPGQGAYLTPGSYGFSAAPPSGAVLVGADGVDDLVGGGGDDLICAYGGADTAAGGNGSDVVFGGAGDDEITDGAGNDFLHGEAGMDEITAGAGDDYLSGGDDFDTLEAHDGVAGNDTLDGGGGVDSCNPDSGDLFMNC